MVLEHLCVQVQCIPSILLLSTSIDCMFLPSIDCCLKQARTLDFHCRFAVRLEPTALFSKLTVASIHSFVASVHSFVASFHGFVAIDLDN